jgi:hypothetical protein
VNAINIPVTAPAVPPPLPQPPDSQWLAGLPLRDFLELGAFPTAPGSARGHVINMLREWGLSGFRDVAEMIISELVTNSVLATGGVRWNAEQPPVRMWMLGDSSLVVVLVWDAVAAVPVPREAGEADESGRGLAIVAALSARWGYYHPPGRLGGKVTWALIDGA